MNSPSNQRRSGLYPSATEGGYAEGSDGARTDIRFTRGRTFVAEEVRAAWVPEDETGNLPLERGIAIGVISSGKRRVGW